MRKRKAGDSGQSRKNDDNKKRSQWIHETLPQFSENNQQEKGHDVASPIRGKDVTQAPKMIIAGRVEVNLTQVKEEVMEPDADIHSSPNVTGSGEAKSLQATGICPKPYSPGYLKETEGSYFTSHGVEKNVVVCHPRKPVLKYDVRKDSSYARSRPRF